MRGINIAKVIIGKRKEKGITQEDLANFVGVSKASVSKWETEQCYPDIVYLPQLAAFFNISLDELMGYEPQMSNEDIHKLQAELTNEFGTKPFNEVKKHCHEVITKYYACFPLLYQMGMLFLSYSSTSNDEEQKTSTIKEAKELFSRVRIESDDIDLRQIALHMEATCEMMLGNPNATIDLLKNANPAPPKEGLLAQAYLMIGKIKEAKTELQENIYSIIMWLFDTIPVYLTITADEQAQFDEIYNRAMAIIEVFKLKELAPITIMPFYLAAAQGYITNKNAEKTLDILEIYTELVTSDIYPIKLGKGDSFFTLIDDSSKIFPLGITELPRDEKSIKKDIADAVIGNPAFSALSDEPRYKRLSEELINNMLN